MSSNEHKARQGDSPFLWKKLLLSSLVVRVAAEGGEGGKQEEPDAGCRESEIYHQMERAMCQRHVPQG